LKLKKSVRRKKSERRILNPIEKSWVSYFQSFSFDFIMETGNHF
jgi:virulence-associated protein VagC